MREFGEYSKHVFSQWRCGYGLMTFGLAVVAISSSAGKELVLPAWAWVSILILSLYMGTFSVYKRVVEQLPRAADLTIESKSAVFSVRTWSGGVPNSPVQFWITLDLINRGQEPATLNKLNVTEFNMNTSLLGDRPLRIRLNKPNEPHAGTDICLPYVVPSGHREPNIKFEIQVEFDVQGPMELAERLNELQSFKIELQYGYEDMRRSSHDGSIDISGSFADFKNEVIESWKQNGKSDLVLAAWSDDQ